MMLLPVEIRSDILLRPFKTMEENLSLWDFFTFYVTGLREEIPQLISQKDLIGLDYILEMNEILMNDVGLASRPFSEEHLCEIKDPTEKAQALSLLAPLAELAKMAFPLDGYKKKALRTLRDTFYRLREDGYLSDDRPRINKEVLFTPEELLKILLEKRMANKRIRKERHYLFTLPKDTLEDLLSIHPKHFNAAIENHITEIESKLPSPKTPKGITDFNTVRVAQTKNSSPALKEGKTETSLSKKEEITLTISSSASLTPALAEEVLGNTASALGIHLQDSDRLLIKALSLKMGK